MLALLSHSKFGSLPGMELGYSELGCSPLPTETLRHDEDKWAALKSEAEVPRKWARMTFAILLGCCVAGTTVK